MTSREFRGRLARLARRAGAAVPSAELLAEMERYFALLSRWNARMNLTALPLVPPTDETFERLFIEPLVAARFVADRTEEWFDIGSGGGSPAIPLKLVRPALRLTMVESKTRKAAFLREVARALALSTTAVENAPFGDVARQFAGSARLLTARAVRIDRAFAAAAAALVQEGGRLLLFGSADKDAALAGFSVVETMPLSREISGSLAVYRRVFHVEQTAEQTH